MKNMKLVSSIIWVKRGIAKKSPDRLKLDPGKLKKLTQGCAATECDDSDEEICAEKSDNTNDLVDKQKEDDDNTPVDDCDKFYDMDKYDAEMETRQNHLSEVTPFVSSLEDEYITTHVDSDDEEKDDIEIEPNDNLVVVAKIQEEEFTLEVHLYNELCDDWYVHHDYLLDAPPLCLEPINYDPGEEEDQNGNLLAVGTMHRSIGIWDLNIIGSVSPVVTLGGGKKGKGSGLVGHEDAVLSLSWNRLKKHVLASGSADTKIILWDIEETKAIVAHPFHLKVQSMDWHIAEASFLLSGTLNGNINLQDCRKSESVVKNWFVRGDVTKVLWDRFNPFCFFVADSEGDLSCFDSRMNEAIWRHKVHEGEVSEVSQSCCVKGLLSTCGYDNLLKVWKYSENEITLLNSENLFMGNLHCVSFSPDSGAILAVGGESSDFVRVVNVTKYDNVRTAFNDA